MGCQILTEAVLPQLTGFYFLTGPVWQGQFLSHFGVKVVSALCIDEYFHFAILFESLC